MWAARLAHRLFPFCYLRTANFILKLNQQNHLKLVCKFFDYKIYLNAHRSSVHVLLWIRGEKFLEDRAFLGPHIKKGMTVFDVGANIGYFTYYLCRETGASGRVFSFEPDADNFRELSDNILANDIGFCYPFQTAVGAFDGAIPFAYGFNGHVDTGVGAEANCKIISLDSFVKEHSISQIDLVKIDVEGYELDVLMGMSQILTRKRKPVLYVEVHPLGFCRKGEPARVCSFLERFYSDIIAFRPVTDVRSGLSPWGKFLIEISSRKTVRRKCKVNFEEVKEHQQFRYQLVCLPGRVEERE